MENDQPETILGLIAELQIAASADCIAAFMEMQSQVLAALYPAPRPKPYLVVDNTRESA